MKLNNGKKSITLFLKGLLMGMADIVPGISGGTVALITGVYVNLIQSISSVNREFFSLCIKRDFKKALTQINFPFLLPLLLGMFTAIISMSRVIHYLMKTYSVQTWSLFFGLILASIFLVAKKVNDFKSLKNIAFLIFGICFGYLAVSLPQVDSSHSQLMIFISGLIAISAMILPGISGSFILLMLGKYFYIISVLKNPFVLENILTIITFVSGCLVGLLSFSKILNYLLKHYYNLMLCFLLGVMIGSIKKIWPWKEVLEQKIVKHKVYVLEESYFFPTDFSFEVIFSFSLIFFAVFFVILIDKKFQYQGS